MESLDSNANDFKGCLFMNKKWVWHEIQSKLEHQDF